MRVCVRQMCMCTHESAHKSARVRLRPRWPRPTHLTSLSEPAHTKLSPSADTARAFTAASSDPSTMRMACVGHVRACERQMCVRMRGPGHAGVCARVHVCLLHVPARRRRPSR